MAEAAISADLVCRACTAPHYGDKIDLLGTPSLTELYVRLSASNMDFKDSLPKQICTSCYHRLEDFNQFQIMCAESYNFLLEQCREYKEETVYGAEIKDEQPEFLVAESLVELPVEDIDFNSDHDNDITLEPVDHEDLMDGDDNEDKKDSDYDPLKDDGEFNVNDEIVEKTEMIEFKPNIYDSDDEVLANKVKKRRGRKRKCKAERDYDDISDAKDERDDEENQYADEDQDGDDDDDDNFEGIESGEKCTRRRGRRRRDDIERVEKVKSEPYACSKCPKKFYKKERYEGHIRQHEGLKPYACPHCHKQYSKALRLKNHITNEHSENPMRFNCTFEGCDKVYRNRESLNWHINTHFNPPKPVDKADRPVFICELCGKALSSRGVLREHEMMHRGEFPFVCDKCPKRFRVANKLRQHKLRHEGIKNYECSVCGMKKTTQHELNMHMNVHTREKQYPCKLCKACFLTNANLVRHIRVVHDRIKLFECTYCDQAFGKAETLKHHVMRHTGEKPHQCPICGKKFIQKTSFLYHVRRHEKAQQKQQQQQQEEQLPTTEPQQIQQKQEQEPLSEATSNQTLHVDQVALQFQPQTLPPPPQIHEAHEEQIQFQQF